ncbi:MAG: hypothetical protein SFU86_15410 [Pirellulaceae bacterium]|nr:hypothetical protein [Pirellulaceae bacterium]
MRRPLLVLVTYSLLLSTALGAEEFSLELRRQVEAPARSGKYERQSRPESWLARETAVIVCDVWDYHHCLNAVRRLEEFAPRLDQLLAEARRRGATIIHAPSDCMPAYAEHPARKRATAVPLAANLPKEIDTWCSRIEAEKKGVYPLDQSDGGEDDDPAEHAEWAAKLKALGRNPAMPWKMQSPLITIDAERDYLSDRGDEVWSILENRCIKHVILTGVHTNMCVLGRPFGLRQMVKNGQQVVLVRDLTDCMYNPRRWPKVDHFTGNDLIVSHVERYICPTITSDQILGGSPARSKFDTRTTVDIAELPAASPMTSLAPFQADWTLIDLPMTWEKLTAGAINNNKGTAWYRCAVRLPENWVADGGAVLATSQQPAWCEAWLNGEPLKPVAGDQATASFQIEPKSLPPREANLLVLKVVHARGDYGLQGPPVLSSGSRKLVLQGRWQMRLGNDPAWCNLPLPAKFGISPDILFEAE